MALARRSAYLMLTQALAGSVHCMGFSKGFGLVGCCPVGRGARGWDDARGIAVGETRTAPGSATPSTRTTSHRLSLSRVSVDDNGVGQGGWTTNDGFATVLSLTGVRVLTGPGNVHWSTIAKQIWISICVRISRNRMTSATSRCHAFAGPWVTAVGRMTDLPEVAATSESSNYFQCLQLHVILRDPATVVFTLI
ncbi:hypothetical protein EDB83DRAFT_2315625 [Lactarius deliciosus]|nr:hypothetical protein EDB83DRAFT_2315625 [Lactarius deliciosus]